MAFSLPNIVIKPDFLTLFHGDTQEHQSTCVDSWVHRVPENGHQPLGRGKHYGVQLAQYCDQTRFSRFFTEIAPCVLPCPKSGTPKYPMDSWVHRVTENWHQPLGRGIHYGGQLAIYYDQTLTCYAISRRSLPVYSLALRLRNTKVPVRTHESIGCPKMDISHWDAAIHMAFREKA